MRTGLWHPDLAEIGELYEMWDYDRKCRVPLAEDLAKLEKHPPAELVFATTGINQEGSNEALHKMGWKLAGTVRNWSAWERGRSRCFVWFKQFTNVPQPEAMGIGPYAEHWQHVRNACMFCCGVRMFRSVTAPKRLLCILRLKRPHRETVKRLNGLGFRQFAKTKVATYYINGETEWDFHFGKVAAA